MKKLTLFFICIAFAFGAKNANAQSMGPEVIGSSGTFAMSASGSMSWTIGEVMTETYSSPGNFFTQGFHQPDSSFGIGMSTPVAENFSMYPNPVIDNLVIDFSTGSGDHQIEIFDMRGKLLRTEFVPANQSQYNFSFGEFENGVYLLTIINSKTQTQSSYRIIKTN